MTNLAEQFPQGRRSRTKPVAAEPAVDTSAATAISPQDFYRELTEREDVQHILTRLAQIQEARP